MNDVRFAAIVLGAFGGKRYQTQNISVDTLSGVVRVWDHVAGHYTTCHSLSTPQMRRLRAAARKIRARMNGE